MQVLQITIFRELAQNIQYISMTTIYSTTVNPPLNNYSMIKCCHSGYAETLLLLEMTKFSVLAQRLYIKMRSIQFDSQPT